MSDRAIKPIPPNVRDQMNSELSGMDGDADIRWMVRRLVENAYAEGYNDGYSRGWLEVKADAFDDRRKEREAEEARP